MVAVKNARTVAQLWASSLGERASAPRTVQRGKRYASTVTDFITAAEAKNSLTQHVEVAVNNETRLAVAFFAFRLWNYRATGLKVSSGPASDVQSGLRDYPYAYVVSGGLILGQLAHWLHPVALNNLSGRASSIFWTRILLEYTSQTVQFQCLFLFLAPDLTMQ